jgi:hypothetical protein
MQYWELWAMSNRWRCIAWAAKEAGLSKTVVMRHQRGWSADKALNEQLEQEPGKANVIADIRAQMNDELRRIRDMEAARSREYRARKRQERAEDDRTCPVCSGSMEGKRADAKVCSDICRVRFHRGGFSADSARRIDDKANPTA